MIDDDEAGLGAVEDKGREAIAHLQRAALEFIDAARLLLDVAEEAVREPGGVASVVSETLGAFASVAGWRPQHNSAEDGARDGAEPASERPARRPGVEHIRIS